MKSEFQERILKHLYFCQVEGQLPTELDGTYLQIGAGARQIFGHSITHTSDADGMVASLTFRNGQIFFRNKFIQTKEFKKEQVHILLVDCFLAPKQFRGIQDAYKSHKIKLDRQK